MVETGALRASPLDAAHRAAGGRMVPFGGWSLPVQYAGIVEEHEACRQAAALFDVSHMGQVRLGGPGWHAFLQSMIPNDLDRVGPGGAIYTHFCTPSGGTVDDLIAYREADGALLVVNASNKDKDVAWLRQHLPADATLSDESDATFMVAVQGPKAIGLMEALLPGVAALKSFHWLDGELGGVPVRVARTGYTGEDGVEIMGPAAQAEAVWALLLERGAEVGLKPAGLGARDTLRLEAGLPLYGHELTDGISPVAAGYRWAVRPKKGDFLGREALMAELEGALPKRIVGLLLPPGAIARDGAEVQLHGQAVGEVRSGSFSPSLKQPIATALVTAEAASQAELSVVVRNKAVVATVTPLPFVKRKAT